jgi:hypothetical protein
MLFCESCQRIMYHHPPQVFDARPLISPAALKQAPKMMMVAGSIQTWPWVWVVTFPERSLGPVYEWPTYTANLCPLCGRAEFASLGEDFGEPIRKSIEALSRRAVW